MNRVFMGLRGSTDDLIFDGHGDAAGVVGGVGVHHDVEVVGGGAGGELVGEGDDLGGRGVGIERLPAGGAGGCADGAAGAGAGHGGLAPDAGDDGVGRQGLGAEEALALVRAGPGERGGERAAVAHRDGRDAAGEDNG